jgi:hypothetical protein
MTPCTGPRLAGGGAKIELDSQAASSRNDCERVSGSAAPMTSLSKTLPTPPLSVGTALRKGVRKALSDFSSKRDPKRPGPDAAWDPWEGRFSQGAHC